MATRFAVEYADECRTLRVTVERGNKTCVGTFGGFGSSVCVTIDGRTYAATHRDHTEAYLEELFKAITGGYPTEWECWSERAESRRAA